MDSKAEYSALSSTLSQKKKLKNTRFDVSLSLMQDNLATRVSRCSSLKYKYNYLDLVLQYNSNTSTSTKYRVPSTTDLQYSGGEIIADKMSYELQGLNFQALHRLITGLIMSHTDCLLLQAKVPLTIDSGWGHTTRCLTKHFDIEEIIDSVDRKLFSQINYPTQTLSTSSPPSQDFHILPL